MLGCLLALIQRREMGLWADFCKRVNGSEGDSCTNWYKRCRHNFQTVLCDSLIWPLWYFPWHPALMILWARALLFSCYTRDKPCSWTPKPLSTHIALAHSSCLAVTSPLPQDLEPFEMYFLARRALYWILSSNGQQYEECDTTVKSVTKCEFKGQHFCWNVYSVSLVCVLREGLWVGYKGMAAAMTGFVHVAMQVSCVQRDVQKGPICPHFQ